MINFIFFFLSVYCQLAYYVTSTGKDSSSCGSQNSPCATINQVMTNYPGVSYTVFIGAGTYVTTPITLQRDAFVIFQGTDNPTILALWDSGSFITHSAQAGFEFHDVFLELNGSGGDFTTLNHGSNAVGFYNIVLSYSKNTTGVFLSLAGGTSVVSNMTITNTNFLGSLIDLSGLNDDCNITVSGCTFTNLTIDRDGGFFSFDTYATANIIINGSTFANIISGFELIEVGFSAYSDQILSIINSVFNNIDASQPSVYVWNDYWGVIYVFNSTWTNITGKTFCGALEIDNDNEEGDCNFTLSNLKFTNCSAPYVGALYIYANSLDLSDSMFSGNSGQVNDLAQGFYPPDQFGCDISNCYSSSALPKAIILNLNSGAVTDISDQLPNPGKEAVLIQPYTREMVSALPKFIRKRRKD